MRWLWHTMELVSLPRRSNSALGDITNAAPSASPTPRRKAKRMLQRYTTKRQNLASPEPIASACSSPEAEADSAEHGQSTYSPAICTESSASSLEAAAASNLPPPPTPPTPPATEESAAFASAIRIAESAGRTSVALRQASVVLRDLLTPLRDGVALSDTESSTVGTRADVNTDIINTDITNTARDVEDKSNPATATAAPNSPAAGADESAQARPARRPIRTLESLRRPVRLAGAPRVLSGVQNVVGGLRAEVATHKQRADDLGEAAAVRYKKNRALVQGLVGGLQVKPQ